MVVLGLNAYGHDAAAVLLVDGRAVYAASEERKDRVRHSGAFPRQAIAHALASAGLAPGDVDAVAFPWTRGMARLRKALHVLRGLPRSRAFLRERPDAGLPGRRGYLAAMARLPSDLADLGLSAPLLRVPHHVAHARSALLAFPDLEAPTAALTADGMGEWTTAAAWLGFRPESDEGKTMGLAAYGDPRSERARFARRLLSPHARHLLRVDTACFGYPFGEARLYGDAFTRALGPARRPEEPLRAGDADVARGIQDAVEEVMLAAARRLLLATGARRLGLAGGLFLNCAMNGRLARSLDADVQPFPVAGDAGAAWGAAAWAYERRTGRRAAPLTTLRLGHALSAREVAALAPDAWTAPDVGALAGQVAARLAHGQVVGVARGRAELGPRALGGRSVLASPTAAACRDDVNARKGREAWRPLAPVVRAQDRRWFPDLGPSPWMIRTFSANEEARRAIPGGVHADGTARVQTVAAGEEPFLEALLDALEARGHPPAVLNTSLNRPGEPIVDTAAQALAAAQAMRLDALVLEDRLLDVRRGARSDASGPAPGAGPPRGA